MQQRQLINAINCEQLTSTILMDLIDLSKLNDFCGCFFISKPKKLVFIERLDKFARKTKQETLSANEHKVILLMINDYERGLFGQTDDITNLIVQKLKTSSTLSQLIRENDSNLSQTSVSPLHNTYEARLEKILAWIAQLPESQHKTFVIDAFIPAFRKIITDKNIIAAMMVSKPNMLHTLIPAIPMHLDHIKNAGMASTEENGIIILDDLINNTLTAIENAYATHRLDAACSLMAQGHCMESRTRDLIDHYAFLGAFPKFKDIVKHYVNNEFLPHISVMAEQSINSDTSYIEQATNFIMARHAGEECQYDPQYASNSSLTKTSIETFLQAEFHYTHQPYSGDVTHLVELINEEIGTHKRSLSNYVNYFNQSSIQTKITELELIRRQLIDDGVSLQALSAKIDKFLPISLKEAHMRVSLQQ
jgi:hypothetical protein